MSEFTPVPASTHGQSNVAVNKSGDRVEVRSYGSASSGWITNPRTGQEEQVDTTRKETSNDD